MSNLVVAAELFPHTVLRLRLVFKLVLQHIQIRLVREIAQDFKTDFLSNEIQQVVPPIDVPSSTEPLYDERNQHWRGFDVVQLKLRRQPTTETVLSKDFDF